MAFRCLSCLLYHLTGKCFTITRWKTQKCKKDDSKKKKLLAAGAEILSCFYARSDSKCSILTCFLWKSHSLSIYGWASMRPAAEELCFAVLSSRRSERSCRSAANKGRRRKDISSLLFPQVLELLLLKGKTSSETKDWMAGRHQKDF